jgi:hypothetical protein
MDRRLRPLVWPALLLLGLVAACIETVAPPPPTTLAQAQTLAAKLKRPVLVDFYTSW